MESFMFLANSGMALRISAGNNVAVTVVVRGTPVEAWTNPAQYDCFERQIGKLQVLLRIGDIANFEYEETDITQKFFDAKRLPDRLPGDFHITPSLYVDVLWWARNYAWVEYSNRKEN